MPRHDDAVRLRHMLDYSREAVEFARGRSRLELDSDRLFNPGMTRLVEIIDESAARLSETTRLAHIGIPWAQIYRRAQPPNSRLRSD